MTDVGAKINNDNQLDATMFEQLYSAHRKSIQDGRLRFVYETATAIRTTLRRPKQECMYTNGAEIGHWFRNCSYGQRDEQLTALVCRTSD